MATIAISATAQKTEFLARLARIEAGTGSSKSTLFVGMDETIIVTSKASAKMLKKAVATPQKRLGPFDLLLCLTIGVFSLAFGLYLQFTVTGNANPPVSADLEMAINGGIGLSIAVFLGYFLRMPVLRMIPLGAIGVLAGMVAFHNLVHFYPEKFAEMFSPIWVEQVTTTTAANSIIWRGVSFTL